MILRLHKMLKELLIRDFFFYFYPHKARFTSYSFQKFLKTNTETNACLFLISLRPLIQTGYTDSKAWLIEA